MGIANYIKEIGRGKDGARALSREQATDLWGQLLDGSVTDLEVGAFCLAMRIKGETLDEIKDRHRIDANDLLAFNQDRVFLKRVETYREEIRVKGLTFRLKARAQAEELLTTSYMLIHDPSVSPAVKADLIKSTVKWAGLEPKGTEDNSAGGGGVKIMINLGSSPSDMKVIDATARVIESDTDGGDDD
jgi:hypothetical protein